MRSIDADAIYDTLSDIFIEYLATSSNTDTRNALDSLYHTVFSAVETAPTISPDEVRGVGTWLRKEKVRHNLDGDGDYRYECSACGHSDEHNENVNVPFCWYCGAKMEVTSDA